MALTALVTKNIIKNTGCPILNGTAMYLRNYVSHKKKSRVVNSIFEFEF